MGDGLVSKVVTVQACTGMKTQIQIPNIKEGVMAYVCNSSTWVASGKDQRVPGDDGGQAAQPSDVIQMQ